MDGWLSHADKNVGSSAGTRAGIPARSAQSGKRTAPEPVIAALLFPEGETGPLSVYVLYFFLKEMAVKVLTTPIADEDSVRTKIIIANADPAYQHDMRQIIEQLHPTAEVIMIAPSAGQPMAEDNAEIPPVCPDAAIDRLSDRQRDVLELLVEGHTNKTIARRLSISPSTVRVHVSALLRIFGVRSRTAAATLAVAALRKIKGVPNLGT